MTETPKPAAPPLSAEIETQVYDAFWQWAHERDLPRIHPDHAPTLIQAFREGWLRSAAQARVQALEEAAKDLDVATRDAETPMIAAGYGMAAIRIRALKPAAGGQGVPDGE